MKTKEFAEFYKIKFGKSVYLNSKQIEKIFGFDNRVFRLISVALVKHPKIYEFVQHQDSKQAIEIAERYADGNETEENLLLIGTKSGQIHYLDDSDRIFQIAARLASFTPMPFVSLGCSLVISRIQYLQNAIVIPKIDFSILYDACHTQEPIQSEQLTSTVLSLARGIYEEKAFDRMPILADALQDAGSNDQVTLDKLRNPNHYWFRGCCLLDTILKKRN